MVLPSVVLGGALVEEGVWKRIEGIRCHEEGV
jgi:hypothetical protein